MADVKIEFINPFIHSAMETFKGMVFTEIERVGLYVKKENQTTMAGDVSVLLSVFGALEGTVVLSFPRKVAIRFIAAMMMDEDLDDFNDDVIDGIGEVGNLVIGSAKSSLAQASGKDISISIPTVLTGKPHDLQHMKGVPCIGCIFNSAHGKFSLEVAIIEEGSK